MGISFCVTAWPGPKSVFWRKKEWFFKRRWKECFSPWREQNNDVVREIELRLFKITLCCLNLTQHYPVARTGRLGRIALVRITNCIPVVSGTNLIFLSPTHTNTHRQMRYRLGPHSKCQSEVSCITLIDFSEVLSSSSCFLPFKTVWHKLTCSSELLRRC